MGAFKFPYNANGTVGLSSDMQKENVVTKIASGVTTAAATKIGFGQPVIRGTAPKTIVPYAGTGSVIGITMARNDIDPVEGFPNGENIPVLNEGQIWVYASGDCTAGSAVEYVAATGGFQDADGGAELEATHFVFDSDAAAGGVVRLQVQTRIA